MLVGREREREMLHDRLTAACAGSGGLVLVGGEAGVGKTALAEALCTDVQQHGALILSRVLLRPHRDPALWSVERSPLPVSPTPDLPLLPDALHTLVRARYRLSPRDESRLVTYLTRRTEGNALFATEMLRTLEERGIVATDGATLGDLEGWQSRRCGRSSWGGWRGAAQMRRACSEQRR